MAKQVATWSYWLGALCALLAVLARLSDMLGMQFVLSTRGGSISYHTLLNAAILLFVVSIATMGYERLLSAKG